MEILSIGDISKTIPFEQVIGQIVRSSIDAEVCENCLRNTNETGIYTPFRDKHDYSTARWMNRYSIIKGTIDDYFKDPNLSLFES